MEIRISEYNETAAGLERLKERMKDVVYDVTTKPGMLSAKWDRRELVSLRTSLEAKRKEIKAPALERCKLIDEEAKRVTAEILALETPIDQQIKAEEARLEAIRLEREEKERQRIADIMSAIERIKMIPIQCAGMKSVDLQIEIDKLVAMPIGDDQFAEYRVLAKDAHTGAYQDLVDLLNVAVELEAEAAKIEAERLAAEAAKLEAERLERERMQQEQARLEAEAEALKKEREAFARQQAEAAKIREEEDRKNREAVEAAEAVLKAKRDKQQAEIDRQAAELKRQQDEMAETLRKAEAEAAQLKEEEAEKQRELDRQAAIAALAQREEAEKARRAEAKARKLAEAKFKDSATALQRIFDICQNKEFSDNEVRQKVSLIAEANIGG